MDEVLLIAGCRNPVLTDYAAHCARSGRTVFVLDRLDRSGKSMGALPGRVSAAVVFANNRLTRHERAALEQSVQSATENGAGCVCVVSTFRTHLGDVEAARTEASLLRRLLGSAARVVVLRPSHVLSPRSRLAVFLRHAWAWLPFVPGRVQGCCVEGEELFAAIDRELAATAPGRPRTYTLLGPNRPWRERLREHNKGRLAKACAALTAAFLPLTFARYVAGLFFALAARKSPRLQALHVETLRPRSTAELLALYNKYNYRHVRVVGYNTGVVHFGQKHPGKTVVTTVGCGRLARIKGDVADFDAGVTVKQAMDALAPAGKELHVLPNYSYVSLGTSYFIPIHGSASAFSTLAETVTKVLLYDPVADRFIAAKRQGPAFARYMYNLTSEVVLLRLSLRVKDRSRYRVRIAESPEPSAREILGYFHEDGPSNVELRKAGSAARSVKVYQYYVDRADGDGASLELPRDAVGRLWDRLEENPVTSVLFHGLVRSLAYHVELFLSERDFATFWETHRTLPILKIQLRFVRKDGFPNSPFREHNCVSADLFLRRKHRGAFAAYLRETLPAAKTNPGKHSR
jgi:hypothetical protein